MYLHTNYCLHDFDYYFEGVASNRLHDIIHLNFSLSHIVCKSEFVFFNFFFVLFKIK